jgi:hypothetical protein
MAATEHQLQTIKTKEVLNWPFGLPIRLVPCYDLCYDAAGFPGGN